MERRAGVVQLIYPINGVAQILDNVVYNGKISWLKVKNWDTKRRKGKKS